MKPGQTALVTGGSRGLGLLLAREFAARGTIEDFGFGIAVGSASSAYVTGWTRSTNFPTTPGAFAPRYNGDGDSFVSKLPTCPRTAGTACP